MDDKIIVINILNYVGIWEDLGRLGKTWEDKGRFGKTWKTREVLSHSLRVFYDSR